MANSKSIGCLLGPVYLLWRLRLLAVGQSASNAFKHPVSHCVARLALMLNAGHPQN